MDLDGLFQMSFHFTDVFSRGVCEMNEKKLTGLIATDVTLACPTNLG
jgi:hypothetical protein